METVERRTSKYNTGLYIGEVTVDWPFFEWSYAVRSSMSIIKPLSNSKSLMFFFT